VQVSLDAPAGGVGGLDDPRARSAQLVGPRPLDLALAHRLLGGAPLGDVEHRAVDPQPPARSRHELAAIEHPAHLAVGAHDPVLQGEGQLVLGGVLHRALEHRAVVGMDDAQQRAPRAGHEVRRQVARDALDLVADELHHVPGVPRRAVDRTGDVEHQRPHEPIVGALARRAQAGPGAGEQLAARERPVQVVVGAGGERRVGPAALRGDGQHPRAVEARVGVQGAAEVGRVEAARIAVDDDQIGRRLAQRRQRGLRVGRHARRVPGRAQPRVDLALGGADHQHSSLAAPDGSRIGHRPIIQARLSSYVPGSICAARRR
jgi:hypothetical protein